MSSFGQMFADFVSDLKSSWRLKAAVAIWIPLFIVFLVCMGKTGARENFDRQEPMWARSFEQQLKGVQFPNMHVYGQNFNSISSITCLDMNFKPVTATQGCGPNRDMGCWTLQLSSVISPYRDPFTPFNPLNHINCSVVITLTTGNNLLYVGHPNELEPSFVLPYAQIGFRLEPAIWYPVQGSPFQSWRTWTVYESSQFPGTSGSATVVLLFRIPFMSIEVNKQRVNFDSWLLLAAWGGFFVFLYLLFKAAFSLAKLFLPDDSKFLRGQAAGEASGTGYQTVQ